MAYKSAVQREIPENLSGLNELAHDLRWSGSQSSRRIWGWLAPELWEQTESAMLVLETVTNARLQEASRDSSFLSELQSRLDSRKKNLGEPGWFQTHHANSALKSVAYFSMEFGLSDALPLYAGGLGILAGDMLKTATDMDVPVTGIGLLYDQGYFEQQLTPDGWQLEAYPDNDPALLPIEPVMAPEGGWRTVNLELPGRTLILRVWKAQVGKVSLYLLDSNDPLNSPWDRAITSALYSGAHERRIIQELILGIGGWRLLRMLDLKVDICHLNEGHAAFVTIARAREYMEQNGAEFDEALWATRAGNLFTTHTPVAAGFDRFDNALVRQYVAPLAGPIPLETIVALGADSGGQQFNMAYLAMRGSGGVNAVSRLHAEISRSIFSQLFPRWPLAEIPIGHVTNAVHTDSWDSLSAQTLWAAAHNGSDDHAAPGVASGFPLPTQSLDLAVDDKTLLDHRDSARESLVNYVRRRYTRQVQSQGAQGEAVELAEKVLDPNVLTLGFARRFAAYKRPTLILHDMERLAALLNNPARPVQLIVAGKAHPGDEDGKRMVQQMVHAARRPDLVGRLVFLADYDIALTHHLAAGADVWINTPRRPNEACGTSGMKVLPNGGLNLSVLDGWWAEAFTPEVGWALGDGGEHPEGEWDNRDANQLYELLEQQVAPEFYERNENGLPTKWLKRIRASMCGLTHRFSGPRMLREYVENYYIPGAEAYHQRTENSGKLAEELTGWSRRLAKNWQRITFGKFSISEAKPRRATVEVALGELQPGDIRVELYADAVGPNPAQTIVMARQNAPDNTTQSAAYSADLPDGRPSSDFTPRVVPAHKSASAPLEASFIAWRG